VGQVLTLLQTDIYTGGAELCQVVHAGHLPAKEQNGMNLLQNFLCFKNNSKGQGGNKSKNVFLDKKNVIDTHCTVGNHLSIIYHIINNNFRKTQFI
jgi:hypothetical protein